MGNGLFVRYFCAIQGKSKEAMDYPCMSSLQHFAARTHTQLLGNSGISKTKRNLGLVKTAIPRNIYLRSC